VVEAVGDVVEAVDVVTGGGAQMYRGIPSESPPKWKKDALLGARDAGGLHGRFFVCSWCSSLVVRGTLPLGHWQWPKGQHRISDPELCWKCAFQGGWYVNRHRAMPVGGCAPVI